MFFISYIFNSHYYRPCVPSLSCNLISVLYLVRSKGFSVRAEDSLMSFYWRQQLLFTASISESYSASLDGSTQLAHSAQRTATLPFDLTLWHKSFKTRNQHVS